MNKQDILNIEALITQYFEGLFFGDIIKLKGCFHKNAYLYGDIHGEAYEKSIEQYLEGVEARKSPRDLKEAFDMKLIGLDIMGKIAMAKVHVPMLGYNYYDYLSLSQQDGKWKIVNKIFTHMA